MDKEKLIDLLSKEKLGTLSEGEQHQLYQWYEDFDNKNRHKVIFHSQDDEQATKQRLFDKIIENDLFEQPASITWHRQWLRAVASIIVLISVSLYFYNQHQDKQANVSETVEMVSSEAQRGTVRTIELGDGTKVWLNAGSKLIYPKKFGPTSRQVELFGEAFFEVSTDTERPFKVLSGDMETLVLGTSFNVRAYKEEEHMDVKVSSGKVRVFRNLTGKQTRLADLTVGERLSVDRVKSEVSVSQIEAETISAWRDGTLIFDQTLLKDVLNQIAYRYDVQIIENINDKTSCRFSAHFKNESLPSVLASIAMVTGVKYKINGHTILLEGGNCM